MLTGSNVKFMAFFSPRSLVLFILGDCQTQVRQAPSCARPKAGIHLQLPKEIVRVTQRPDGIELYFPPLRAPEVAAMLGMFGVVCIVLPLFAIAALLGGSSEAYGLLAIALASSFVAPFPIFGAVFIALAVYLLANSLTVTVSPAAIRSVRRVFGLCVRRREINCREVAALEEGVAAKYQSLFSDQPRFRLIARHAKPSQHDVVVAETLAGEAMLAQVRSLIAENAGLNVRQAESEPL